MRFPEMQYEKTVTPTYTSYTAVGYTESETRRLRRLNKVISAATFVRHWLIRLSLISLPTWQAVQEYEERKAFATLSKDEPPSRRRASGHLPHAGEKSGVPS